MTALPYHIPVMLGPCIEGMAIDPNGIYIDLTFGGGGHSREILKHLDKGHLYGFDQDLDAEANIPEDVRFTFIQAYFRDFRKYLRLYCVSQVD
jgi:16S rRNA (cytosine1402-N4)-methyltransferase